MSYSLPHLLHSQRLDVSMPSGSPIPRTASGSSSTSSGSNNANLVTIAALNSEFLVLGLANSHIRVYSTQTGELLKTLLGHKNGVWALSLVTRGGRPWAGAKTEEERDLRTLVDLSPGYLEGRGDPSNSTEGWGQRATIAVSGGSDRVVAVWDLSSGKCNHTLQGHSATIRCIKTLANRPVAVSGSRDATLRVWDINKGRLIRVLTGHTEGISCMEVCGDYLATGSYDSTCRIWNVDTGECVGVLTGHQGRIYSISFDGTTVVSGGYDGTVRIWHAATSQCRQVLSSSRAAVTSVLISPSSQFAACASTNGTVVIYSLSTYQVVHAIAPHQSSITALQFEETTSSSTRRSSPSTSMSQGPRNLLLSAGADGWVRRFDIDTGRFMKEFCEKSQSIWKVVTKGNVCAVVCERAGSTVVEVWSTGR